MTKRVLKRRAFATLVIVGLIILGLLMLPVMLPALMSILNKPQTWVARKSSELSFTQGRNG